MISKVTILDANYNGLGARFPDGLELDTDSPIVLIVGPNNVGKWAFARMLATAIDFGKYFRSHGISHFWDYSGDGQEHSVKRVIEEVNRGEEVDEGVVWHPDVCKDAFDIVCERRGIDYRSESKLVRNRIDIDNPNSPTKYHGLTNAIYVISQEGRERIRSLERLLRTTTDENVWGFVKPTMSRGGEVYYQEFVLPQDQKVQNEQMSGLRRYTHFVNREITQQGEPAPSPGTTLYRRLESFFENIERFFEERQNPRWERARYSVFGREDLIDKWFALCKEPVDGVPTDARLCVFMDEPTIYLDPINHFRTQETIRTLTERYAEKLQFFVATNDRALIGDLEGRCVYLNLFEQPVTSSRDFDVRKYIPTPRAERM